MDGVTGLYTRDGESTTEYLIGITVILEDKHGRMIIFRSSLRMKYSLTAAMPYGCQSNDFNKNATVEYINYTHT
jgi:hypothetical protein